VMSPPRMLKTACLADVILRYPGPVIATSTKPDIYALTAAVRVGLGPVHVFNPQHIGGVASTFRWSPVDGCQDPATAIRRADAFAFSVSQKGVEDGTFWAAKASDYLRAYFHAAALARYDLRTVPEWVSGADPDVPERILLAVGARQWAVSLAELRSEAHKTTATVRMVMSRALSFMADPALAASVLPAPGAGFDSAEQDLHEGHRLWPHIQGWAEELGLTAPDAIDRVSQPPSDLNRQQEQASRQPDREAAD
jgi:type IV secretion system protein VirD4